MAGGAEIATAARPSLLQRRALALGEAFLLAPIQAPVTDQLRQAEQAKAFSVSMASKYAVLEALGQGSTGVVYKATSKTDGTVVALKTLRTTDIDHLQHLRREYDLLRQLDHANIIKALEFTEGPFECSMALEYFDGFHLKRAVRGAVGRCLSEETAQKLFAQLLSAIDYLHQRRIVHRDVKADNVLVTRKFDRLKLIDFNTAHNLADGNALTMTGTHEYVPPEVMLGESPSESGDIWGAGLCLYYMLAGCFPERQDQCPNLEEVVKGSLSPSPSRRSPALRGRGWSATSDACKTMVQKCLELDKARRPAAMILLADPWFLADACATHAPEATATAQPPSGRVRRRSCGPDASPGVKAKRSANQRMGRKLARARSSPSTWRWR